MHGNINKIQEKLRNAPNYSSFIVQDSISTVHKSFIFKTVNEVEVTIFLYDHRFVWRYGVESPTTLKISGLSDVKFDLENELLIFILQDKDFLAMKL